jgi:hypothetical protein
MTSPSQYQRFLQTESNKAVIMNTIRNGRVNVTGASPPSRFQYPFFQEVDSGISTYKNEAVKGILLASRVQAMFFSPENINNLQQAIQYYVYQRSNQKIKVGRQSDTELEIIMRSVYLQYGKNQDVDIVGQVKELNAYVLEYAVKSVISNATQYLVYKKDISQLPVPLDLPIYSNAAGTRTHPNFIL